MSLSNSMLIAIHEISDQIDHFKPTNEKIKDAMTLAKKHWLVTDEDERFRSAIGAILLKATPEEKEILESEMEDLMRFSSGMQAASLGVPVDIVSMLDSGKDRSKFYGIMKIWKSIGKESI